MFVISIAFSFLTISLITAPATSTAYDMGFIFGRAIGTTLFPVLIALIPAGIYKFLKKKQMPGFIIVIWCLWAIFTSMALFGNMLEAQYIN